MSFEIGTLGQMAERLRNGFKAALPQSQPNLWPNNIYVSAKVYAAACWEILLRLKYIEQQAFVVTSSNASLDRHGSDWGVARKPETLAEGVAHFTGTVGAVIFVGATLTRVGGVSYTLMQSVTIGLDGTGSGIIRAASFGVVGNTSPAVELTIMSPPLGIDTVATTGEDGIGSGYESEDMEDYRARILFRKRNPPAAGSPTDLEQWAMDTPGCTRAFCVRAPYGPGTTAVFPLFDDTRVNGIPLTVDLHNVSTHILAKAPAGAILHVEKIEPQTVDIVIAGLNPDTPDMRIIVIEELRDLFHRQSSPALPGPYGNQAVFSVSWIWQTIANTTKEKRHALHLPAGDIQISPKHMPFLGTVTFV